MSTLPTINIDGQIKIDQSVFPSIILAPKDIKLNDSIHWLNDNISEIESLLSESGAILFRGFPLVDAETFDAFSSAFNYPTFTYQDSLSNAVRINFTERVFTANEAPKEVEIYLHHEMAQTPISPDKLFFFCKTAADDGGATPICRSDALFSELKASRPVLANDFKTKGLRYTNIMPAENNHESGQGRSWKNTLSVTNISEAETKLKELGYTWEWLEDGRLRATTPILPAVIEVETPTGIKEVFYNQLVAAYMGWEGVREDPSVAITYGDGSPIPKEGLDLIVQLSEQFTFDIPWQDGDMALVDNKIAMHGRRPYRGERKRQVLVALAA